MTKEEIQFCDDNLINFESVKLGFTRNIPLQIMEGYESLYRKYLDSQYSLTYWCGECVFEMLTRLIVLYENAKGKDLVTVFELSDEQIKEKLESELGPIIDDMAKNVLEAPKKRGRKKK